MAKTQGCKWDNAATTNGQTCYIVRCRAIGLLRRWAMFGLLYLGRLYSYSSYLSAIDRGLLTSSIRPKIKCVGWKTPPTQMVKLAKSCNVAQFQTCEKSAKSIEISVPYEHVFTRFRLFEHVLAYFVVTIFFSDFL